MGEAPVAPPPRRAPGPMLSPLKDTLVVTNWEEDPPPPAPEIPSQTLPRRPTSISKPIANGDIPSTNSIPRRPHSIAVTSAATANGVSFPNVPLYRAPIPPASSTVQAPIRRPHSIAATPTTPLMTTNSNSSPFKMNGMPPWPVPQKPPIVARRPHSVATTPLNGNTFTDSVIKTVPWNGIQQPVPRRPHSIAVTESGGENGWPNHIPPLQHPIARRPPPVSFQYSVPNTSWNSTMPRRPYSIASSNSANSLTAPSESGYRSITSSQSDYQVTKAPIANGLPPHDPRRLLGSAHSQLKPSQTFHGLPFKPFNCGASNGLPLFLGCTHPHGSRSGTPATTPSKTAGSTPSSIREAVQHLLAQPRNGFKIMDDKMSLFIDIMDAQERFSQVTLK